MNNCQLEKKDYEKMMSFMTSIQENLPDFRLKVLQYLSSVFSFDYTTFILVDKEDKFTDLIGINISEKLFKLYNEYYFEKDIFNPNNHPADFNVRKNIVTISDLMTYKEFEETEFYRDFLRLENFYYHTALYLRKGNRLIGGIGILKDKASGDFTKKELSVLNMLTPHISKRLDSYLELTQTRREQQIYRTCLKHIPVGVIFLDSNYSVLSYNEQALECCKDILYTSKSISNPVEEVIKKAFSNICLYINDSTLLINSSHKSYEFSIKPVIIPNLKKGIETCFIVSVTSSYSNNKQCNISTNYNLTQREIEIVELIAQGLNNNEIADRLYISYHTVRTHVENILSKMNVNNRTSILHKLGMIK